MEKPLLKSYYSCVTGSRIRGRLGTVVKAPQVLLITVLYSPHRSSW